MHRLARQHSTAVVQTKQTKQEPRRIQPEAYADSSKPSPTSIRCVLFTIAGLRANPTQPQSQTHHCHHTPGVFTPQTSGHSPQPTQVQQHDTNSTQHSMQGMRSHTPPCIGTPPGCKHTQAALSACPRMQPADDENTCKDGRHPAPETSPCFVPRLHPGPVPTAFCCSQPICPRWPLSSCVHAGPSAA